MRKPWNNCYRRKCSRISWCALFRKHTGICTVHYQRSHIHTHTHTHTILHCRHYNEGSLKLLELSLDINLARNALVLEMEGAAELIPNVCVHESRDQSMVVVLFASCSAVYRLVLPHPAHIMKVCVSFVRWNCTLTVCVVWYYSAGSQSICRG